MYESAGIAGSLGGLGGSSQWGQSCGCGNELANVGSGLRETQPDSGGNDHVFGVCLAPEGKGGSC